VDTLDAMAGDDLTRSRARRWSLSPSTYRRLTLLAALALAVIIVTGALVRLTGSGLGCPDWPECNETRFVDVSSTHGAIEQVNRLFTGLVAVAVVLAVLGSLVRNPRRRDLTWLSLGLVAGVIGQIVLGGVTVLTDLHPAAVQAHFVLSIVILTDALVLHQRASEEPGPYRPAPDRSLRRAVLAASALVGLAIVTGTVVTGTGPHGGDEDVRRFGFAITDVARIHSVTALVAAAALVWLAWRARRGPAWAVIGEPLGAVLAALVVQGTIGYMQYFNGIPVPLVALHVIGSVVVWWLVCRLTFATRIPVPQPSPSPDLLSTSEGQVSAVNR
jgi:cytochrome c oxidase assembly protein subunit 15